MSMKPMLDFTRPMTKCDRCGMVIALASESARHEDSHPFRLAKVPKGVCANCVMTQFLYNTYPINMQIDEAGPELLLNPGIREAFLSCGMLAHCDLNIDEVDWQQVVANWELPVKLQKTGMNPYRMGESPRAKVREQVKKEGLPKPAGEWADLAPQGSLAKIGKEQFCPKCGHPISASEAVGGGSIFTTGGVVGDSRGTYCVICQFQSGAVWIRDVPSEAVQ